METEFDCLRKEIESGDKLIASRLEDALVAADKLELARLAAAHDRGDAIHALMDALAEERQIAFDKFEVSVARRFSQVNEFRGALSDLSKDMATRRELETLDNAFDARFVELGKQFGDLRSRVDVGPASLVNLQSIADRQSGRQEGASAFRLSTTTFFSGLAAVVAALTLGLYVTRGSHSSPTTPTVICLNQAKVVIPC